MKYDYEKLYSILFDGFYEAYPNSDGHKATLHPYEKAKNFRLLQGKLKMFTVMVDYDNPEAYERRLKIAKERKEHCIVIKSQSRGGHFYFFNNSLAIKTGNSKNVTMLTLYPVDYKIGFRAIASRGGEIKAANVIGKLSNDDGTRREIVYANPYPDGTLDEIPIIDQPIKTDLRLLDMVDGDGRDDAFRDLQIDVKKAVFSYEQFIEAAEIINKWILKEPLDKRQFETVTRRELWDGVKVSATIFGTGTNFKFNLFGDYLIKQHHIVKINGQPHIYHDGVYVPGTVEIERVMLEEIPDLRKRQRSEILDYVWLRCEDADTSPFLNFFAFKNGIYNFDTDTLEAFNPSYIVTNKIPWNYNKGAKSELVDRVLDDIACGSKGIRRMLEQVAGACLYRSSIIGGGKAVILKGDKSNGKSTFIEMIAYMLGEHNYSVLELGELGDRFSTSMMYGKLANLGDDISDRYRDDVSLFRKIVTGNEIKAEEKGQRPFSFKPYCTQIFSANTIPRMNDPTGAVRKRLFVVPMKANFFEGDKRTDTALMNKIKDRTQVEHIEFFIQCALDGLADILNNGNLFIVPDDVKNETDAWEKENNPMIGFLEDVSIEEIINNSTQDVYRRYRVFCEDNNHKPLAQNTFTGRLQTMTGLILQYGKIKGKTIRIYRMPKNVDAHD